MNKPEIKIPVRRLVEFLLRSGDITEGMEVRDSLDSMQAGSRIHKKIQKSQGMEYHAEVPLSVRIDMGDYDFIVQGRADGIVYEEKTQNNSKPENYSGLEKYTFEKGFFQHLKKTRKTGIDEIKGTFQELRYKKEPDLLHLAQAKCYGFIFLCANGLDATDISVTYCNLDTEVIKKFTLHYTREELTAFFTGLVEDYRRWADFSFYFAKTRTLSIQQLKFPFEYRQGQFDLMASVYRSIVNNGLLFLMAPTGTGKTLSTLFPAVMSMGQGLCDRIFYLTAKTMTARNAIEAFEILKQKGYRGKTVSLTAKEKMCVNTALECSPISCPYAKGHFDRINDALYALLTSEDIFSRDKIRSAALDAEVCPYLMEYDLCDWCDNIIGDVNYVFDPKAYLKRFFASKGSESYVFLIDEAHNLPERGRMMYSASIDTTELAMAKKPVPKVYSGIKSRIGSVQRAMKDTVTGEKEEYTAKNLNLLMPKLLRLKTSLDEFLGDEKNRYDGIETLRQLFFDVSFFLEIYENLDQSYVIKVTHNEKFIDITLMCIDPSKQLQQKLSLARSAVLFSATLLPFRYYRNLSCTVKKPYAIYAKSIFPRENRLILSGSGVTSVYKKRTDSMYEKYASYLRKIIGAKQGNYMVFAPSYAMIGKITEQLSEAGFDMIIQTADMTESDRDDFISQFYKKRDHSLVAFCIAGGIFGEGVDLTGEALIGVVIIGVPLPKVSFSQQILSDYFEKKYQEGFSYAYLYPAVNKVLQSAGRLIRTETDRGVIVLLDDRYTRAEYKALFPTDWNDIRTVTEDTVEEYLKEFWKSDVQPHL